MASLQEIIVELESTLQPLYDLKSKEKQVEMHPMDQAKINMTIAYVINALFYMYLKVEGIDPENHPFSEEMTRVKSYMKKLKDKQNQIDLLSSVAVPEGIQEDEEVGIETSQTVEPLNSTKLKPDSVYLQNISNSSDTEDKKRKRTQLEHKPKKKKI